MTESNPNDTNLAGSSPLVVSITTGNEISVRGKIAAGIILVFFLMLPLTGLIAFWPNRLPKEDHAAIYRNELFNICLLDSNCHCIQPLKIRQSYVLKKVSQKENKDSSDTENISRSRNPKSDTLEGKIVESQKSPDTNTNGSANNENLDSSTDTSEYNRTVLPENNECGDVIYLNTILIILIALAGFMGSMIHTATSFVTYVGSDKFKKSWLLWYIVKPFTGACLAVVFYFVLRAGFINFNDTSNINIYGLITFAAMAGLFTDKATLKLEEIFTVIFKPNDNRPNKLDETTVKIKGVVPEGIFADRDNNFIISGEGLNHKKLFVKINDVLVQNPVISKDSISFSYKAAEGTGKDFRLSISDESGAELYVKSLGISPVTNDETTGDDEADELEPEVKG